MATAVDPVRVEPITFPLIYISPPPIRVRRNYHWTRWAFAIGLIIALAVIGELWRMHSQNAITYQTVPLERGLVQASVTATGTVNAVVDVQVGSQVSGNIKALYADFNTKVTKGQLVGLIDPEVFQAQVDQAQAAMGAAQSAVIAAGAQVLKANSDLSGTVASEKSAESALAKDRATALNARNQWTRVDELFKQGIMSRQDDDAAKATTDADDAQAAADQDQISVSKQTIQSAQDQVSATQAQLASAKDQQVQANAVLAQAKINLAHTRITAPVDGHSYCPPNGCGPDCGGVICGAYRIRDRARPDEDAARYQRGRVRCRQYCSRPDRNFYGGCLPTTTFQGQVTDVRKAPIITQNVVTYDVVIAVSNPDLKLFPGMTANARILTTKLDDTFKVPNAVLRLHPSAAVLKQVGLSPSQAGKQHIYVLQNGKLKAVPVTFGISDGQSTAMTSGDLQTGEQVVVRFSTGATAPTTSAASPTATSTTRRVPGL